MKRNRLIILFLIVVAVYALFGFLIVPPIIKPIIISTIEETTHRPVSLGSVSTNPFALSITLEDFDLHDLDDAPLVSFKELYINYELRSLFQNAFVLSELRLDTPQVSMRIKEDGLLSINDILETAARQESSDEEPMSLVLDEMTMTHGSVTFE